MCIIVDKHEEILFTSKAYGCYWSYKVSMDKMIGLCYSLLGCTIILLYNFRLFAAITDVSFSIISIDTVIVSEMSFQYGKIEVIKTLVLASER